MTFFNGMLNDIFEQEMLDATLMDKNNYNYNNTEDILLQFCDFL